MYYPDVPEMIDTIMANGRMTQTELAETLGVAQSHVSRWRNGMNPNTEHTTRIKGLYRLATSPNTLPKFYVYALAPIDYWDGWTSVSDFRRVNFHGDREMPGDDFFGDFEQAKSAIQAHRYFELPLSGDGRWMCAPLPPDDGYYSCPMMFAIKIQNNGTTFIASPYRLPWLE